MPFPNPFRPGAGHQPPYLAGRGDETGDFEALLSQNPILANVVLTGLRGVGKTVLLDTFKPLAIRYGWLWVGTDMSEAATVTEESLVTRLLADLAVITANIPVQKNQLKMGFQPASETSEQRVGFEVLVQQYQSVAGLAADKLKAVFEWVWSLLQPTGHRGVIFAYDEAQTMSDHAEKGQYPLAMLLDVFQSIQKRGIPFMLVLAGLPTLFPKLVEARTFSERMFRVIELRKLSPEDSRCAIEEPTLVKSCQIRFQPATTALIIEKSSGYPYFIQFICRETFDLFLQKLALGEVPSVPIQEIMRKLDKDFFSGRWARATDRQRELLRLVAGMGIDDGEFTVLRIVEASQKTPKPFSAGHVGQLLTQLIDAGLVYRNRHGRYAFAVPLLGQFILRQEELDQLHLT